VINARVLLETIEHNQQKTSIVFWGVRSISGHRVSSLADILHESWCSSSRTNKFKGIAPWYIINPRANILFICSKTKLKLWALLLLILIYHYRYY